MENSNHVFTDQLRAWNRSWSGGIRNCDESARGENIDAGAGSGTHTNTDSAPKRDGAATEKDEREPRRDDRHRKRPDEAMRLTPLEKARLALSRLPTKTKGSEGKQGRNNEDEDEDDAVLDSIVPCLFSVLETNVCDSADSTKDVAPSPSRPQLSKRTRSISDREASNTYELRQIEWHVVLVLELLACAMSSNAEGKPTGQQAFVPRWSKSMVLKALVASIGLHREAQIQRRIGQTDNKKSKKPKKPKKKKKKKIRTDPQPLSEKEKEDLVLTHLVQTLSRAPFVLPRDIPLSEFLIGRCFARERRFWERLSSIVSHIFESFEIPNPYRPKPEDDLGTMGGTLFSPSNIDTNRDTKQFEAPSSLPGGKTAAKSALNQASLDKKRKSKRERLQELAKTKKRQRLASLTSSKKKHRGSHFHRNLDDISKLLDKKKNAAVITNNDALAKLKNRKLRDQKNQTDVFRLSPETSSKTNRQVPTPTTGSSNKRLAISRTEQGHSKQATRELNASRERKGGIIPLVNRKGISLERRNSKSENDNIKLKINHNDRQKEGIGRTKSKSRSINDDSLPTTPQRSLRFDATAVLEETPVPNTPNIQQGETTVGETPVPGLRSRFEVGETPVSNLRSRNVVGETPPPGSGASDSPMSSSSDRHSFSPPPLPSTFVATSSAKDAVVPSKQPVRLFGLSKRASCIKHSGGKPSSGAPKSDVSKGQRDLASIDKARAYLRRKST